VDEGGLSIPNEHETGPVDTGLQRHPTLQRRVATMPRAASMIKAALRIAKCVDVSLRSDMKVQQLQSRCNRAVQ